MLRPELPLLSEVPDLDDEPAPFDPSPEWFVPGLKPSPREDEAEDDGLGLRSLIERPEVLARAWRTTGRERPGTRAHRPKLRHAGRSPRWSHAA
jgi:hypothetical protein